MPETANVSDGLVQRLYDGDEEALGELFAVHRDRLWRMVHFRLDRRVCGRVDADDVLQEAYLDAAQRVRHYLNNDSLSFFVWLRQIVVQTMIDIHRQHLDAQMRDANREVSIHRGGYPQATSISMAARLLGLGGSVAGLFRRRPPFLTLAKLPEVLAPGWVCANDEVDALLGGAPWTPLEEGCRITAAWYRERGWL